MRGRHFNDLGETARLRNRRFCALHTYGRKLNWNCHVHASATPFFIYYLLFLHF
uniref:transposase n=1 Tax=Vibrio campbellii TaxID=680 RepID=UPI00387E0CAC